jgi:hypothetical protein
MKNKREAAKVLASVIDDRTTEVRDALFDSGVKISPNADKDEIVYAILENLGTNRRLQKRVGKLALEVSPQSFPDLRARRTSRRPQLDQTGFFNQSGDDKFFQSEAGQQTLDAAGQLAGTLLGNFLANRQAEKQAQLDAETAESQARLLQANAELVKANLALENIKAQQASMMTPTGKMLMGVILVGALLAGFYFYNQSKGGATATN